METFKETELRPMMDSDVRELLSRFQWHAVGTADDWYPATSVDGHEIKMGSLTFWADLVQGSRLTTDEQRTPPTQPLTVDELLVRLKQALKKGPLTEDIHRLFEQTKTRGPMCCILAD